MPIFYRFRDTTIFLVRISFFVFYPAPSLVCSHQEGCSPVTCGIKVNLKKTGVCGLPDGENLWPYEHLSSHGTGLWRTDYGQIDRRTAPPIRKSRLSIAERDRNRNSTFKASVLIYLTKSLSM